MDIEQISNAMSGTTTVINAELPNRIAGKDIKITSAGAFLKFYG